MIFFLLAILFTVQPQIVDINQTVAVTLEIPSNQSVDAKLLKGKLLSSGDFMLVNEKLDELGDVKRFTWTLEPLRSGIFPLSLYKIEIDKMPYFLPAYEIEVRQFNNPENLPPPPFLPLKPIIPPEMSLKNQELYAALEAKQPSFNKSLLTSKAFPWNTLFLTLAALCAIPLILWVLDWKDRHKSTLTPEEEALKEIQELNALNLKEEPLINRLSQTVRYYIQNKYGISSPHLTTEEFLSESTGNAFIDEVKKDKLGLFLKAADQVKFGARKPSQHEIDTAIAFAKSFVKQ